MLVAFWPPVYETRRLHSLTPTWLRIVLATVPRLMESHVVSGLQLDPPPIVLFFWCAWNESENSAKSLYCERLNFDPSLI
jgi:hypothetical protein